MAKKRAVHVSESPMPKEGLVLMDILKYMGMERERARGFLRDAILYRIFFFPQDVLGDIF